MNFPFKTTVDQVSLNYYKSFFEACRSSAISCIPMDTGQVLDIDSALARENHGVTAYIVPQALLKWPSFRTRKQQYAIAPDVLCIRTDPVSTRRQEMIIESLVEAKRIVVVIGSPGIGTWHNYCLCVNVKISNI